MALPWGIGPALSAGSASTITVKSVRTVKTCSERSSNAKTETRSSRCGMGRTSKICHGFVSAFDRASMRRLSSVRLPPPAPAAAPSARSPPSAAALSPAAAAPPLPAAGAAKISLRSLARSDHAALLFFNHPLYSRWPKNALSRGWRDLTEKYFFSKTRTRAFCRRSASSRMRSRSIASACARRLVTSSSLLLPSPQTALSSSSSSELPSS